MRKLLTRYLAKPRYNAEAVKKNCKLFYLCSAANRGGYSVHTRRHDRFLSFQLKLLYAKLREMSSMSRHVPAACSANLVGFVINTITLSTTQYLRLLLIHTHILEVAKTAATFPEYGTPSRVATVSNLLSHG